MCVSVLKVLLTSLLILGERKQDLTKAMERAPPKSFLDAMQVTRCDNNFPSEK